jgi:hypothetical protein
MAPLHTTNLKVHRTSIRKASHRWEAAGKCTCSHPRVIAARRRGQLLHCRNLSASESHRL